MFILRFFSSIYRTKKDALESNSETVEIKGYMLISEPKALQKLDVSAYLDGNKNAEMKNRSSRYGLPIEKNCKIYDGIFELFEAENKTGFARRDGSNGILCLKCSREETYKLIKQGKFHEAIEHAMDFREGYGIYLKQKSRGSNVQAILN